jgi:hypothetical protein
MTRTSEEGDRIEEQAEEHLQSLQEAQSQHQEGAKDDLKPVTIKPYLPELFLG